VLNVSTWSMMELNAICVWTLISSVSISSSLFGSLRNTMAGSVITAGLLALWKSIFRLTVHFMDEREACSSVTLSRTLDLVHI